MKKNLTVFFTLAGGITLAIIAFIIWGLPYFQRTTGSDPKLFPQRSCKSWITGQ
jgi:hypothetical protein